MSKRSVGEGGDRGTREGGARESVAGEGGSGAGEADEDILNENAA